MRFLISVLLSALTFVADVRTAASASKASTRTETGEAITADEEKRRSETHSLQGCRGLDPPINNRRYLAQLHFDATSDRLTDDYRNITVDIELRRSLYKNPLLHFYVTDADMYSYQCGNRDSCTYKLCNPETSQEVNITKQWQGKCPLEPGKYHYEYVFPLTDVQTRQESRTSTLKIQAQLHEGYECLACVVIKLKVRKGV